ncbi:unnamed protein product, partial [marine sediment metagenome]
MIVQRGGFNLAELRLEDVFYGLHLDAVAAHLELRVGAAEEMDPLCAGIDPAFIPGPIEAAETR